MSAKGRREQQRRRAVRVHRTARSKGGTFAPQARHAEVIATDPDLANYLRAPYDPLYDAQATRFFSRGLLHAASAGGGMRIGVLVVAMAALVGMVVGVGIALNAVITREGQWGAALIWSLFFAAGVGLFGITLLRRLLRIPAR
jgi:hypothetical protein